MEDDKKKEIYVVTYEHDKHTRSDKICNIFFFSFQCFVVVFISHILDQNLPSQMCFVFPFLRTLISPQHTKTKRKHISFQSSLQKIGSNVFSSIVAFVLGINIHRLLACFACLLVTIYEKTMCFRIDDLFTRT